VVPSHFFTEAHTNRPAYGHLSISTGVFFPFKLYLLSFLRGDRSQLKHYIGAIAFTRPAQVVETCNR
jgi:hypothetical protein